jgi:integrase
MAGHWRKRGNRIELRAYVGLDPLTGRKRYATRTIQLVGKREAEKALSAFVAELAGSHSSARGSGKTFGELLEQWFTARSGDWSPGTAYQTRWIIDHRLEGLRDRPMRAVDTAMLDEFYGALRQRGGKKGKPLAASSVQRVHGVVRLALDQAVRWGWRSDNPALKASPGKAQKAKISPPSTGEVTRILEAAAAQDPELLTFLFLDAETGARRGELSALRLYDFDDDSVRIARSLTIGLMTEEAGRAHKNRIWPADWQRGERPTALIEKENPKNQNSIRTISLSPATMVLVREQCARLDERALQAGIAYPETAFLFPSSIDGLRPWRPDTWTRRFARIRDALEIKVRLHDVRHFVATTLLTSGVDLGTVAGRLGHGGGGKTTLAIYSHFLREPDRVASDVMARVLATTSPSEESGAVIALATRRKKDRSG